MIYKPVQRGTYLLDYAGQRFLVNPVMGGLQGENGGNVIKFGELLDVDAVIATHLTAGAFDGEARRLIPRGMKVFVQDEKDADSLSADGFSNLEILTETTEFCHLSIRKTPAFYRVNGISAMDQKGCGVLISHPVLNSAYLAGESSWYDGMKQVLKTWKPRLIVVSAGFSGRGEGRDTSGQFGMSREEIAAVHLSYPRAHIITTGCPDHTCSMVSRRELEKYVEQQRMEQSVWFPKDGEEYRL